MWKNRLLLVIVTIALLSVGTHIQRAKADSCSSNQPNTCGAVPNISELDPVQLAADMTANPSPTLSALPVDLKRLYGRAYRKVLHSTDIYDTPHGNVVGHIDAGLNFVNGGPLVNGWVQIGRNQWLPQDAVGPINSMVSKYSGVLLPDGMPDHGFGWILVNMQPSATAGATPDPKTPYVKRYTLVNLFAVDTVDGWNWYLIGPDQWVSEKQIARVKPAQRPNGVTGKWFAVDLYEQTLIAYDGDTAVFATLVSSGLPKWPTAEGLFKVWDRQPLVTMTGGIGQPDFYNLPDVPWAMYFNKHDQSIHGAYWHDNFGYRQSHGCVNLSMTDAQWAFNWLSDESDPYAYIYHSGVYRQGAIK